MKVLKPSGRSSPLMREAELWRTLKASGLPLSGLRVTFEGQRLFMDGFVDSLDKKLQAEETCRKLAPGSVVVNRLRVAAQD